jgi:N-acetylmuramoyl-L-alanine amidase
VLRSIPRFVPFFCSILLSWLGLVSCNALSQASPPEQEAEPQWAAPLPPTQRELQRRLDLLVKDSSERALFRIDERGIAIYPTPERRTIDSPEVIIYREEYTLTGQLYELMHPDSMLRYYRDKGTTPWNPEWQALVRHAGPRPLPPYRPDSTQPLTGWRIAVDPGHVAGDLATAEIEGKYVKMHPSRQTDMEPIGFWEANLTLATAHLVREALQQLGAKVMMTRYNPGLSIDGQTYQEWKAEHWPRAARDSAGPWEMTAQQLRYWLNRAKDQAIFRTFYNAEDLRNRAKVVNAFRPHCTLIIHYNIHGPNWQLRDAQGFLPPADTNYLMAFVPGSFLRHELETREDRAIVLRLLLTDDWEESVRLGTAFVQHSRRMTGVPPVPPTNGLRYLDRSSLYVGEPGLYARNLSLTRLIRGPLVYGESFNQDYLGEALRLDQKDTLVHGIWVSSRVEEVAQAYVASVLDFAAGK